MMTDLNKVVKVALVALTMLVGAQGACADDVTPAELMESTKAPFGFATLSSRTEKTAYNITGGGAYTVSDVKALVAKVKAAGGSAGSTMTVDGKKVIVLEADGTKTDMASTIKTAIESNDIIVFDGDHSLMGEKETGKTNFYVDAFITLSGLSGKTIIGMNGARLCTTWYLTDIIKSWLNSVETSSGSGVSNASTAAGTGGTIVVNGKEIAIDEEGEYLTRKTLVEKGEASKAKQDAGESLTAQDEENIKFLLTEAYRRSGVFYITNCSNLIIRNLSFQGPGSVDVGGYDLVSVINGTNHVWVDHCEFIDGQDGNFDITNESDFITTSWCHFHYTDRSYVHQNTNLVGSNDKYDGKSGETFDDTGKLNITFAYNEWGENCRSRMPMARFGKIHMLNNWYNCPGNTENAINPRKQSEFLIEGNYFVSGITKTFKASEATGISASDNTLVDPAATSINASGSAVTVPYTYGKVASTKVPDMVELLVGPILDKEPNYTVYPKASEDATINTQYDVEVTATEAESGLTFSVWADNAMTYQWYSNTTASEEGATPIEGATRNAYTYRENSEGSIYLYCVATGVGGVKRSNFIHVTIKGTGAPKFFTNLKKSSSYIYDVILGTNYSTLRVDAGNNVTYQWYKNTSAASTTGAVAIDGATSATYTIDASERVEKGSEYYYCVATRPDGSYSSTSNIARVRFVSGSYIIKWKADKDTPKAGDADLNGIENKGTASYAAQDGLGVLKLGNGPSGAETNGFKLTANDGFQVGDVITFAGFYNNSDAEKNAHARLVVVKNSSVVNLYDPNTPFVNKNGNASAEPVDYSYTLKAGDLDDTDGSIYVARGGNTACFVTKIYVSRGNMDDANPPVYETNLNSTYNTTVGSAVSLEVKMEEEAKSYAWYVSTTEDGEGNPQTGETGSSFSYTPKAEGTTYVYCVVTNGAGIYAKTLKSVVAAVTANKPVGGEYTWDMADWSDIATDKTAGESQHFSAKLKDGTFDSTQLMYYYGKVDEYKSENISIGGVNWTKRLKFAKGTLTSEGENYVFKYHAPGAGTITVYAKGGGTSTGKYICINTSLSETGANMWENAADGVAKQEGIVYEFDKETDIYIWGKGGSNYIYGIVAKINAVEKKKVEITQDWVFTEEAGWGSDESKITISANQTVNGLTAVVAADNSMEIDDNDKTLDDKSFTRRMKLGKTGSSTNRCLKFDVLGPTVIDVWAMSGSSQDARPLYYKFGDADAVKFTNGDLNGSSLQKVTANYTGKTPTTVYIYSGNGGINVYGIKAVSTVEDDGAPKCKTPTATKGAYVAGSGYKYTIATATVIAKLRYTIGGGAEQTTTLPSAEILVPLGASVSVKAVDLSAESPKTDSETLTFTGDATMPKVTAPTIAIGKYSFTTHKFPVTITSKDGGAIHYTTDGTAPTASSPTYSTAIGINPSATVKAMVVKDKYSNSNVTEATALEFNPPTGTEIICARNGANSNDNNLGVSYFVDGSMKYNAGAIDTKLLDEGLKYRTNNKAEWAGNTENKLYGIRINVNDGFIIKRIVCDDLYTNADSGTKDILNNIYVDNSLTGVLPAEKTDVTLDYRPTDKYKATATTIDVDNLNAHQYIDIITSGGNQQLRATFQVYYEVDDEAKDVVINDDTENPILIREFTSGTFTSDEVYSESPKVVIRTEKGFEYNLEYDGDDKLAEGGKSRYVYTVCGTKYTFKATVTEVMPPVIKIADDFELVTPDAKHITTVTTVDEKEVKLNGGYGVKLTDIKDKEDVVPYIVLDGGTPQVYDKDKKYYALKTVTAYCKYGAGEVSKTDETSENCPENTYNAAKPFAIYVYQYGYSDTGAGQESGATASTWDKTKDQTYLGLTDKYNVIDLVLHDADQKKMINAVRPDIRNAKLVAISEMIGSKSPEAGSVYAESKLQDAIMSVRDSLIGYTNVLNLKMFFYSQSQNNTTRWAWAQPATLPNDKVSIMPTDAMYQVFENVSFSRDGSIALWSGIDEESTLNRLQLVHNFNEDNEDLPSFTQLATATDDEGEVYDALHWFKKDGYQYIATGISINDYAHYDTNLRRLVATIGDMINNGEDLDTRLTRMPAPRISDNGDGSATITNNNPSGVTYYRTSKSDSEEWTANDIKTAGGDATKVRTVDANFQTVKFNADSVVYAVTYVGDEPSDISKAEIKGSHKRYIYRTNTTEGVTGVDAAYEFSTDDAKLGEVKIPYNQSFYKEGYTVTKWRVKDRVPETLYTPGEEFPARDYVQDLTLEAVWEENAHLITDADITETDDMRTVTWNLRQSGGAPALSLEAGSTKLGQTGIIVGQMKFSDGKFIDVPMTIDANGSAVIPLSTGSNMEGSAKFNNTSTNYVEHDFAQVRTGTKFTFPAVCGMTVKYVPTQFKKLTGTDEYEVDETYVTMSTLTDGTLTILPSNPGLNTADGKITITDGKAAVATDNRTTGGTYAYNGEAKTATLTSIDAAMYAKPESGTTGNTENALNTSASVFMDKVVAIYPQLHDLITRITLPENNDSISAEPQVRVELTPAAKANCNGRYLAGTELQITVTPSYGYDIADIGAVTFSPDGANNSKTEFVRDAATGVVTGKFTMNAGTEENPGTVANVAVSQKQLRAYTVQATPPSAGSVRVNSNTGKGEEEEYLKFVEGTTITFSPTPKIGYQFDEWVNANGDALNVTGGEGAISGVSKKIEEGEPWRGDLDVVVNADNSVVEYYAKFKEGYKGTVYYQLNWAGEYVSPTEYRQFGETLAPGDSLELSPEKKLKYLYDYQYPNYKFPTSRETTALYIPTNYTLYKEGYTLKNWAHIAGFNPASPATMYEEGVEEYKIGGYYYFNSEGEKRNIIPIFVKNREENAFDYRTTTADITWDFRTAYRAQRLYFDEKTEKGFDYATHTTINGGEVIDVPLHIKGKVDNTVLDEWCHFDEGTEITIPSGLGAKFTLATYNKLSSTTIDGVVPTDYTMKVENKVPVYYYTYVTPSTATSVKLLIGSDHTYYKSIRAQLPSADKVKLITTVNNGVQGSNSLLGAWSDEDKTAEVTPAENPLSDTDTEYTLALGSYVTVKATRRHFYELKGFMVDGKMITAENATAEGYTLTEPDTDSGTDYTLTFRLFSYATTVEAVFGDRETYQITYGTGGQAYGEAPGVQVVERGESFTMPAKNQTLYMEGYTLKYWMDEDGVNAVKADGTDTGENKYEWGKEYKTTKHLYLIPVFEINDFTLFDIPSGYRKVSWPLITGNDATYGNGPLLKYQKSAGVTVSQLKLSDAPDSPFIDMPLNINCTDAGKVDNSSTDYRCQVNSGSLMTLQTNANCKITVYTSNGTLATTKIAGSTSYSNSSYTGSIGESANDHYATVSYTGKEATQDIEFTGDAPYLKMVEVEYGKVDKEGLPKLEQVTVNNVALGSFGSKYQSKPLSDLINDKTITIDVTLATDARTMPKVKAEADQEDAIVTVTQATIDNRTATIILRDKNKATVGIYKIDFNVNYADVAAPKLQKIEMSGKLVQALNVKDEMQGYLEDGATMNVNGAISITFNQEMVAEDFESTALGQTMSCVATNNGKTLVFSYWGLTVDKEYTFTIPSGTLKNAYEKAYASEISFTFKTAATSQVVRHRNVDFVVTHSQTHTFNSADPTKNYTSTAKRQVANDELIANLEAAGIAYGTIDEGLALANSNSGTERYYIFVPNGEYQIKGDTPTDAIQSAGNGYAPADNSGAVRKELMGKQIYNGVTVISHDNISITGQDQEKTKLWNKPEVEGISYTSTFFVKNTSGFYVQDMTLQNAFDYKNSITKQGAASAQAARAVVLRDRGYKTIMKNVTMDSWQDTYYSNLSNRYNDSRGYFEDCTIKGYVDFFCGDGDQWFERCNLMLRNRGNGNAVNIMAPATYDNQLWGYVFSDCRITAEDDASYKVNNGKFTLARPWKNSPAASFLRTTFDLSSTDDGYKQMTSGGLVLRFHEYGSKDANGTLLDLSLRSLRASSPGPGSYSAVMTPDEAAQYTVHNALGGADGYDPTLYTKQISMENAGLTSVDRSLSWEAQTEALCYFIFRKNASGEFDLYAITEKSEYELNDDQIGRTFIVRAANQRGGLGEPSNEFVYEVHESFKLTLTDRQQAPYKGEYWDWSTIYLDYNAKAPTVADDDAKADVYVYAVVDVQGTQMTLKRVKVLEKNQGYIVKGKAGTYTFSYTDGEGAFWDDAAQPSGIALENDRMSILDGVTEETERDGMYVYTMYYKQNYGLGFYNYTGEFLGANKAYLDGQYVKDDGSAGGIVIDGSESTGFIFLDDLLPTDLQKLRGTADDDSDRIYTVYGQRVKRSEMIKGRVYIVNGRKIAY